MVTREDIAGAAHIGGKLVDFVERAIDRRPAEILLPEVADDEIVGLAVAELRKFQVDPANPEPFLLQAADEMAADESAGPANKSRSCAGRDDKLNLPKNMRIRRR
jgi:hypothetical protein